jgi:tetratricopeptide (TPR) repeat protein
MILTPDSRVLVTVTDTSVQFWDIGEIPDDPARVQAWVELTTGMAIFGQDEIRSLDAAGWQERRELQERLGGLLEPKSHRPVNTIAPETVPVERVLELIPWVLPIELVLVLDNMVRAQPDDSELIYLRGLVHRSRGSPSRADDDFIEAFARGHRDPRLIDRLIEDDDIFRRAIANCEESESRGNQMAVLTLRARRAGRLARQHRWTAAAVEYENAIALSPDRPDLRRYQLLTLLAAGDHEALRRARSEMIQQFAELSDDAKTFDAAHTELAKAAIEHEIVSDVAWFASVAPGDADEFDLWVRLPGLAVDKLSDLNHLTGGNVNPFSGAMARSGAPNDLPGGQDERERRKAIRLKSLGAVLFRAGRYAEAAQALEGGTRIASCKARPQDWAFLALTRHRLGHNDDARRALARLRDRQPSTHPAAFWDELEISLLRSEAEAVILYDPIFPADPFGH